jgi:hypothetical protein
MIMSFPEKPSRRAERLDPASIEAVVPTYLRDPVRVPRRAIEFLVKDSRAARRAALPI